MLLAKEQESNIDDYALIHLTDLDSLRLRCTKSVYTGKEPNINSNLLVFGLFYFQ
jgi:hypothetical protein